jgi:YebC/PmpR family DNA-binding regulatory protein
LEITSQGGNVSGHSKWSQIKRQKQAGDVARGKIFSKLSNTIAAAVKSGGKDPAANVRLRLALEQAKGANMPSESVERAIKRGAGELPGAQIEEVTYEAYGPGGVAILIEATTDSKNRTTADLRAVLTRFDGKLAGSGAVSYLFEKRGVIISPQGGNEIVEAAIDAKADDFDQNEAGTVVYCNPKDVEQIKTALVEKGCAISDAKIAWEPKSSVPLNPDTSKKVLALMDALEELEDVSSLASNFDIPEEVVQSVT